MRKIFSKVLTVALCGTIMLSNFTTVEAKESNDNKEKVLISQIINDKGEVFDEYIYLDILPAEKIVTKTFVPLLSKLEMSKSLLTRGSVPSYTSTLTGAYNNYTQAKGSSTSTMFIDRITVAMTAYKDDGTSHQGSDINPLGTQTTNSTVFLEIPPNIFNIKYESAVSYHTYSDTRYVTVDHSLSW